MSAQSSSSGGPYRKPRLDVYTVMLALALVAIIIACIVLYAEVADYGKPPYPARLEAPVDAHFPAASTIAACCSPETRCALVLARCGKTPIHG